LLSSAILYVAIVVIWACVLIPRWLRRDSSASDSSSPDVVEAGADPVAEQEPAPAPAPAPVPASVPAVSPPVVRRRREELPRDSGRDEVPAESPDPVDVTDPAHRRVVSARRRLLMMLVGLSVASGVLAGTRMAAWWVIVPPSVMLLGYLLLLREAAKADAERREMARYRMERAAQVRARRQSAAGPASSAAPAAPAASVASVAPEAKVFTIPAPPERAEEEIYDQYADAKLRAVGD
jgi:hypothetical protein